MDQQKRTAEDVSDSLSRQPTTSSEAETAPERPAASKAGINSCSSPKLTQQSMDKHASAPVANTADISINTDISPADMSNYVLWDTNLFPSMENAADIDPTSMDGFEFGMTSELQNHTKNDIDDWPESDPFETKSLNDDTDIAAFFRDSGPTITTAEQFNFTSANPRIPRNRAEDVGRSNHIEPRQSQTLPQHSLPTPEYLMHASQPSESSSTTRMRSRATLTRKHSHSFQQSTSHVSESTPLAQPELRCLLKSLALLHRSAFFPKQPVTAGALFASLGEIRQCVQSLVTLANCTKCNSSVHYVTMLSIISERLVQAFSVLIQLSGQVGTDGEEMDNQLTNGYNVDSCEEFTSLFSMLTIRNLTLLRLKVVAELRLKATKEKWKTPFLVLRQAERELNGMEKSVKSQEFYE
jgi:hypothetical protein